MLAVPSLTMASNAEEQTSCVKCDARQPKDGKLLDCMHVICAGCAVGESNCEENSIKCVACGKTTKPRLSGVPIARQLANCLPLLYEAAGDVSADGAGAGGSSTLLCALCPEDYGEIATHECQRCGGAAICEKHAEVHSRTRMFAGHAVSELRDGERPAVKGAQTSGQCPFHSTCVVATFCQTCSQALCTECLASGHELHTFTTLKSEATRLRSILQKAMDRYARKANGVKNWKSSSYPETTPCEALISEKTKVIERIKDDAVTASSLITTTLERVEALVRELQQKRLSEVEKLTWRKLAVHENEEARLRHVQEKHFTVVRLVQKLTGESSHDTDVIRLAEAVNIYLINASTDFQERGCIWRVAPERAVTAVVAPEERFKELEKLLPLLVEVMERR